ncbi:HGxxPAAW family protein [Streptomyces sp. NPDC093970]|uniref:HGxxPAAW family protein n=1 Tax=Streptomyces sp. NPDC093970 TaxID=3155076 RepID=UPI003418CC3E
MSLHDEGHTVAGWTGTAIATAGSGLIGWGVCAVSVPALVAGGAVTAVSVLVTWCLHLAGWGKPPGPRPRPQWPLGVRDTAARDGHAGCVGCRLAGRGRRTDSLPEPVTTTGEPEPATARAAG